MNQFKVKSEVTRNSDDIIIKSIQYDYDENGNLLEYSYQKDEDADGAIDLIRQNNYNSSGDLIGYAHDFNGDGNAELSHQEIYDDSGNLIRSIFQEKDINNPQLTLDFSDTKYIYDDNFNLIELEIDNDEDSVADEIVTYTYNEEGIRTQRSEDNNIDGIIDRTSFYDVNGNKSEDVYYYNNAVNQKITYLYDENNNLIEETEYKRDFSDNDTEALYLNNKTIYKYDENNNIIEESGYDYQNELNRKTTYVYDSNNNLTQKISDYDGDNVADKIITKIYDEHSNLLSHTVYRDHKSDLDINESYTHEYDLKGNLIETRSDLDSDGEIDEVRVFNYDSNDNLSELKFYDEAPEETVIIYEYDSQNNLTSEQYYLQGSSEPAFSLTYFNSYDENNNLIKKETDYNDDGVPSSSTTYTYDTNNRVIQETIDYFSDAGSVDEVISYTYNNRGDLVTEKYDYDLDYSLDSRIDRYSYTYDSNDNLLEIKLDLKGDGTIDILTTYTYDENHKLITERIEEDDDLDDKHDPSIDVLNYAYNTAGKLISASGTLDYNNDGIVDHEYVYFYNENESIDTGVSKEILTPQTITTYSYLETEIELIIPEEILVNVHRFYQEGKGFHFYTTDSNEINYIKEQSDLGALSYSYEAEKYTVLSDNKDSLTGEIIEGVKPVYRFFNTDTGAHLYTMNEVEKDVILDSLPNYNFEGIKYYAFTIEPEDLGTIPVFRMLNNQSGAHLFTIDNNEIDYIQENLPNFLMENNGNAAFYVLEL